MNSFKEYLQTLTVKSDAALATFRKEFDDLPYHALEWGDTAVRASTDKQVARELLKAIEHDAQEGKEPAYTYKRLSEYILDRAISCARNPTRSTSPMHTVVGDAMAKTWADLVDVLRYRTEI